MRSSGRTTALLATLPVALMLGCGDEGLDERARLTCEAVSDERFDAALAASEGPLTAVGADRETAECRCIALLSLGDKTSCTGLLAPLLAAPEAQDWVPHPLLTKLMVRSWREAGEIEAAAALASRAAPHQREDLDLLQLELMLASQIEGEERVLAALAERLGRDPSWTAQRLVLALAWNRRAGYAEALRVLGEDPPPADHPLLMPWFESRIQAQAAAGDLPAVQQSFERWRGTGWDPVDLAARYALRLSVDQLIDPSRDTLRLLQEAIATQDRLRDRNVVWGLHRRLITELLARGRAEEALAAYDAAAKVLPLEGITREEIERAAARAEGELVSDVPARLRFAIPAAVRGGTLLLSPQASSPPDAGYRAFPLEPEADAKAETVVEIETRRGPHPLRYVLRDERGDVRASGAIWPEPAATLQIAPTLRPVEAASRWRPAARRPADGRRRVFAILADCADWRITEYLRARKELPFQDHLFSEGFSAVLESRPAFTAAALQSLVWPARPQAPSALGWIHRLGLELAGLESVGRNPLEWLALVLPERPNLFETLGGGERVAANMLLAHGRIDAGRHAEITGPRGDKRALSSQDAYRALREDERARYPELSHDPDTRRFAQTIAAEMDAAEQIAREGEVDFLLLRLEALDLITHAHFAPLDGHGQDDARGPLTASYRYIDERLAALYALLDEDDWLVYFSDHGIRSSMEHEEDAVFVLLGDGVPQGRAPGRPALRGLPRSFAAMLEIETAWPETGATPWLTADGGKDRALAHEVASHP
jgi:tetratricopeptide (TPR) repeat protein